ncbi:cytochrome b5-like heme/steroid binding domain-containing protein [Poronia punctata]|nr:cytochrome b5-like heme/steroid binding domain-containing protein [Poronia punctata]
MTHERPVYTLEQVSEHCSPNDLWIIIRGRVYDVSSYLDDHPGGKDVLLQVSGGDATEDFDFVGHSADAKEILSDFEVGLLAGHVSTQVSKPSEKLADMLALAKHAVPTSNSSRPRLSNFAITMAGALTGAGVLAMTFSSQLVGLISAWIPFYIVDGFFSGVLAAFLLGSCAGGVVMQRVRRDLFDHKDVFQHVPYVDCRDEFL